MTLREAEEISRHVAMLVASRPPNGQLRVSQLRGHKLAAIRSAFALDIAKQRQVAGNDPKRREISRAYADKAELLVGTLWTVLLDEDVDRLERLERGSPEFNRLFAAAGLKRSDQFHLEEEEVLNQEALSSFDNYCWSLEAADPLYWQKIYTYLCIPYDETCPSGEPDLALNDRGNLTWQVKTVKEQRKIPLRQVLPWAVGVIVLIWLFAKAAK